MGTWGKVEGGRRKEEGIPLGNWVEDQIDRSGPKGTANFVYVDISSIDRLLKRISEPKELATENAPSRARQVLRAGDVLVSMTRPNLNAVAMVPQHLDGSIGSTGFHVLRPKHADPSFLYYAVQTREFIDAMSMKVQGALYPAVRPHDISAFCLPPFALARQRQIVAKIEELFSELDAGEESLRSARQKLGVYRQALLKQAFEGKLTGRWRERNSQLLEDIAADKDIPTDELERFSELPACWRYTRFGRFIHSIDAGKSFRCEERRPKSNEIGVAKVSAVTWGEYDEAESKTCMDPSKVNPSYFIRDGDFLLSRANTIELVGACVIVRRVTQPIMLSDKTLRLSIDRERKSFLLQYLRSHQGRREIEKRSTGNQESMRNIGQERIRSIVIPECSLPEQQEIVRLLDEQFTVIDQNEREIDAALKRSEALRQSILKKAFTGQLVPQDPADEPASALLERIRAERESKATAPKMKSPAKTRSGMKHD